MLRAFAAFFKTSYYWIYFRYSRIVINFIVSTYTVPAAYKNMWGEGLLWYVNLPPKEGTRIGTEGDLNNTSPMSRARHWGNLQEGNLLWRAIVSEEKIASHSGIFIVISLKRLSAMIWSRFFWSTELSVKLKILLLVLLRILCVDPVGKN